MLWWCHWPLINSFVALKWWRRTEYWRIMFRVQMCDRLVQMCDLRESSIAWTTASPSHGSGRLRPSWQGMRLWSLVIQYEGFAIRCRYWTTATVQSVYLEKSFKSRSTRTRLAAGATVQYFTCTWKNLPNLGVLVLYRDCLLRDGGTTFSIRCQNLYQVLSYAMLCYSMLYHDMPYHTIICYAMLYYTIFDT